MSWTNRLTVMPSDRLLGAGKMSFFQPGRGECGNGWINEVKDSWLCAIASSGTQRIGFVIAWYQITHDAMRLDTSIFWCEDR